LQLIMRKLWLAAIATLIYSGLLGNVTSAAAPAGDLTIIQIKMTGSETIVLENTSPQPLNLSNYLLEYFNKAAPASLAVPTSTQQLPSLTIAPKQSVLISGDSSPTCGASVVAGESFTMSDTGGYVLVAKTVTQTDGSILTSPTDHVSWTSSTTGADLTKVPSNTSDPNAVWYRKLADGSWTQAELGADCAVLSTIISPSLDTTYVQWSDGIEAPASIVSLASSNSVTVGIPSSDIGLSSPQITELLPNPAAPQTDDEDEFIEIYNPNDAAFDLSGFKLQVGLTTKHSFTFSAGTVIGPRSFRAFFSVDTGLAMSNSSGQAALLDPYGTAVTQSQQYSSAKEGQLANGQWYWTNKPTPNASNVIAQAQTGGSSKSSKKLTTASVKGASTTNTSTSSLSGDSGTVPTPVHPWTIAVVGSAALIYAGYEYRADLANNLYRFRRYLEARRSTGK
jgi:hypothetical protein